MLDKQQKACPSAAQSRLASFLLRGKAKVHLCLEEDSE